MNALLKFSGILFFIALVFSCNNNPHTVQRTPVPVKWTTFNYDAIPDSLKEDAGCCFSKSRQDFDSSIYSCYLDWNSPLALISVNNTIVVLARKKTNITAGTKSIHETYSNGDLTLIINIVFIKKSPEDGDELEYYDGMAYLQSSSGMQSLEITGGCGS